MSFFHQAMVEFRQEKSFSYCWENVFGEKKFLLKKSSSLEKISSTKKKKIFYLKKIILI